jgi:hypothetical protein
MYNKNLELLGIGLSVTISIITNLFLILDVNGSPKSDDPVVAVIIIGIISLFISTVMFLILIVKLHHKFSLQGSPIIFTKDTRTNVEAFKTLFITNNVLIWLISFLFFSLYKIIMSKTYESNSWEFKLQNYFKKMYLNKDEIYVPFYNTKFTSNIEQLFLIFKIILTCSILGISGYMIYLSSELSKISANRVYIPDHEEEEIPKTVPKKQFMNGAFNIFQNLNLNYILNSRMMLNL